MKTNKMTMESYDDAYNLLIAMRKEEVKFILDNDPVFIALVDQINKPDYKPLDFKPRSSGPSRPMSAPANAAERRARTTKSNKTAAQREAHRVNDKACHEDRIEDAPTYVNQQIQLITAKLLGEATWEAVEARAPAGSTTIETHLRRLASNADGLANITLDAKAASTRGRWKLFAMMQAADAIANSHEHPTPEQLKILHQGWYDASTPLKKSMTTDKSLNRSTQHKSKRSRVSESGRARASAGAAGSSSGLAPPGAEDELVPAGGDAGLSAEVRDLQPSDGDYHGGSYAPVKNAKRTRPSAGAMDVDAGDDNNDEDEEYEEVTGEEAGSGSEASEDEDQ